MMRIICLTILLAGSVSFCAVQAVRSPGRIAAIRGAVAAQISALRAGDPDRAYAQITGKMRSRFGNAAVYLDAVRLGLPRTLLTGAYGWYELREAQGRAMQRVALHDGQGRVRMVDFDLVETADGWRIEGIGLVPLELIEA